jgi:membrane fusion protein (multidrug efflux system)
VDEQQPAGAKSPAVSSGGDVAQPNGGPSFWKRRPVIVVGTTVLAALVFFGLHFLALSYTHETTDDAFLSANVVALAPNVAGHVLKVHVADNQRVKAGDVLVEIDPRDFEIQSAQKKAALAAADANTRLIEASLIMLGSQVSTAEAAAQQSESEAAADQAAADKAAADLKRAEELIEKRIISQQEYDAVRAAADAAHSTLKAGRQKAAANRSKVTEAQAQLEAGRRAWERAQAQAAQSQVDVQQADLNLSYARIAAPQDGRVTRKAVQAGDYVQVGQKLMALVPEDLWVTANFKETQLRSIRPGQPVSISVDSLGGQTFAGHVDSVQAGSGAAFSLLPPENAVGNYVKVVQRVPVKIVFDQPIEAGHVLGPGMSVVPFVEVSGLTVPDLVTGIVAAILALVAGGFWWRTAGGARNA